jgi:hypothetical protein
VGVVCFGWWQSRLTLGKAFGGLKIGFNSEVSNVKLVELIQVPHVFPNGGRSLKVLVKRKLLMRYHYDKE